jgi:phenylalanyl-tRNA synthetase beta chain
MRIAMSWLRDLVDSPWGGRELGSRLTMSGFELESMETAAPAFSGVVVAEIIEAARHPQADKLRCARCARAATNFCRSSAAPPTPALD